MPVHEKISDPQTEGFVSQVVIEGPLDGPLAHTLPFGQLCLWCPWLGLDELAQPCQEPRVANFATSCLVSLSCIPSGCLDHLNNVVDRALGVLGDLDDVRATVFCMMEIKNCRPLGMLHSDSVCYGTQILSADKICQSPTQQVSKKF